MNGYLALILIIAILAIILRNLTQEDEGYCTTCGVWDTHRPGCPNTPLVDDPPWDT